MEIRVLAIRYLRGGLWVPLANRMAAEGMVVDQAAANLAVGRWLREVANVRAHATTGEVPSDRLEAERQVLGPIPPPYDGQLPRRAAEAPSPARPPLAGLQHPLALYDALFAAPGMPGAAPLPERSMSALASSAPSCAWRRCRTSTSPSPRPPQPVRTKSRRASASQWLRPSTACCRQGPESPVASARIPSAPQSIPN
ncbi:hypothetical protein [Paracraurococcus lichenis]|uniref:Transposase n=1 Tax=Paracraurococcus lichenis TaxID=3064888 RepID=A0ABT9E9T2_9PROT|nr:hypothetical protein [Paracraurococcus sp. LOR1-02]MDO9712887.1 hypothetical protein [Paracraurococcus sp. LOR1-02]